MAKEGWIIEFEQLNTASVFISEDEAKSLDAAIDLACERMESGDETGVDIAFAEDWDMVRYTT